CLSSRCEGPEDWASNPDRSCSESESGNDVAAPSDSTIKVNLGVRPDLFYYFWKGIQGCWSMVQLAPAMIRNYNAFSAVIRSSSGILVREDSFQHQREPSYFAKTIYDLPGVGGFLANMSVIAIDDRVSERTNNFPTVSQNDRRGQWRACLVLLVAGTRDRHVNR